MRHILCYGDSNTWGYTPGTGERHAPDVRWTGVLRRLLGEGWEVLEEGMNGRTTVFDNPMSQGRNGSAYLLTCLETHKPLDPVSYTHLRAHETGRNLVCRLLLEKKKKNKKKSQEGRKRN